MKMHYSSNRVAAGCMSSLALGCALAATLCTARAAESVNLALVATASTSFVSGHETITALNDGATPANSNDKSHGAYGNWPRTGTQWVQYDWSQPISTCKMDVYWFDDHGGVRLPPLRQPGWPIQTTGG